MEAPHGGTLQAGGTSRPSRVLGDPQTHAGVLPCTSVGHALQAISIGPWPCKHAADWRDFVCADARRPRAWRACCFNDADRNKYNILHACHAQRVRMTPSVRAPAVHLCRRQAQH